MNVKIEKVFA